METQASQQKSAKTVGFFGIFISLLGIFLIAPFFADNHRPHIALQLCFLLLLISLSYAVSSKKGALILSGTITFSFLTFDVLSLYFHSLGLLATAYVVFDLFLFIAVILLLKDVVFSRVIDNNLIFGAMTAYLLIGILWGKLYFLVALFLPGSFHGLSESLHDVGILGANFAVQFDLFYFSFTTLATLGLGDIYPTHHLAKTLTILEAIFGQLFLAVVIAKLVSAWHQTKSHTPPTN